MLLYSRLKTSQDWMQDSLWSRRCVDTKTHKLAFHSKGEVFEHCLSWCAMTCPWFHESAKPSGSCYKSIHQSCCTGKVCRPYTQKTHGTACQTRSFWHSFQCSFGIFGHSMSQCRILFTHLHIFNVYTSTCLSWDALRRWRKRSRHRNCPLLRCSDQWRMSARLLR